MSSSNRVHGLRTAAGREAECLRTSRGRADEIAGEAAAREEDDQRQTAAARDSERLDTIDNAGAFTHNCRDIRPRALIVLVGLFCDVMLPTEFSLFISCTTEL